ncbi:alpha/beta fold hydrolase [Streptomyces sp. NPDC018693]|uniref:alpha/beta fold hydrolase n=1 Tax=unclassified Streptomyces TaxID=2593676 RepID=UPI0037A524DA
MPIFTAADGTELAYHLEGDGEPLVVLPGGPMRASAYLGDLGGLGAHRRLVLLDLRGTGDSAPAADPETYRCDRLTDDVEALRAHLGLERMDLLGHSAGGSLATLYAARHPDRVARLALITTAVRPLGLRATPQDRRAAARLRQQEPWFDKAYPRLEAWLTGEGECDDDVAPFFYGRWDAAAQAHAAAEVEQTNEEASDRYYADADLDPAEIRARLIRLTAPVLLLAGELDGGPRPALARRTADAFPNAEVAVQPGAGHFPWLDDPAWFVRRVTAFLDEAQLGDGDAHVSAATATSRAHR